MKKYIAILTLLAVSNVWAPPKSDACDPKNIRTGLGAYHCVVKQAHSSGKVSQGSGGSATKGWQPPKPIGKR